MKFSAAHKFTTAILLALVAVACAIFAYIKVSVGAGEESAAAKNVSIQAQIETDGSMSVIDQRTFTLQENEPLCWEISKTTKFSATTVSAVRAIVEGEDVAQVFALKEAETDDAGANTWHFDEESNCFVASISAEMAGKNVVLEVSYVQNNAVFVYDDVAELYWDYLPAENAARGNISAQVLIPNSPSVEVINQKTAWGWGHGCEGSVEFVDVGGYLFESNITGFSKKSDVHIVFPANCLVNFDKNSQANVGGARKNSAISEEAKWTDEWSVEQANSTLLNTWECVASFFVTFMAAIAYAGVFRKYKRILGDNVSLRDQLTFDENALKFQKRMLILSCILLLISLFCIFRLKNIVGSIAFLMSFVVCLLQSNWTPSVHSSFRDRIK